MGGEGLYSFVRNRPVSLTDFLGLIDYLVPDGVLTVDIGVDDVFDKGENRKMTIRFKATDLCRCKRIDFRQDVVVSNLDGHEPFFKYRLFHSYEGTINVLEPDPPWDSHYIKGDGMGDYEDGPPPGAWMVDIAGTEDGTAWFMADDGTYSLKRRIRQLFRTCAECIEGDDEGSVYGCVSWAVDFGMDDRRTQPEVRVVHCDGSPL